MCVTFIHPVLVIAGVLANANALVVTPTIVSFIEHPNDQTLEAGQTGNISCSANISKISGSRITTLLKNEYFDHKKYAPRNQAEVCLEHMKGASHIKCFERDNADSEVQEFQFNVTITDSDFYYCIVKNEELVYRSSLAYIKVKREYYA